MKKVLVVMLVVAIALVGATAAMANIANSKHDLTATSTGATIKSNGTGSQISSCQFCHTPHRATTSITNAPLWNRNTTATASYKVYGSITTGGVGTTLGGTQISNGPGSNSLTCLSCHDGLISVGSVLVGATQTMTGAGQGASGNGILDSTNVNNIGTDLTNDHPIGMTVAATGSVAGLADLSVMKAATFKFYGASTNTMECATCHDPHSTVNSYFLRVSSGTICAACHVNK